MAPARRGLSVPVADCGRPHHDGRADRGCFLTFHEIPFQAQFFSTNSLPGARQVHRNGRTSKAARERPLVNFQESEEEEGEGGGRGARVETEEQSVLDSGYSN